MPVARQRPPRKNQKRGQTAVEYLMLLSAVVGMIAIFRQVAEPQIVQIFAGAAQSFRDQAWLGNEKNLESYYQSDEACMVIKKGTGTQSTCQN